MPGATMGATGLAPTVFSSVHTKARRQPLGLAFAHDSRAPSSLSFFLPSASHQLSILWESVP